MEAEERTEFLKNMYSKDGLNLSVGRLTIGSSDYSAELYSYDDYPFDTELLHFSIEHDEAYIIPMIREILKIRPNLYLFASPWSPPGWMKTGGSLCGGYMREEYVEVYADYIIKYLNAYNEHGINISTLTPQNEPETHQNGRMPACLWHPDIESRFIRILRKKIDENGLKTKIRMHDHNFSGVGRVLWMLEQEKELASSIDGVAFHYYDGIIEETVKITDKYPNLNLHFTEGGARLYDHYDNDWCKWGIMATRALACGYKSMSGWNLLLDETGNLNIGPFSCGGFVTRNSITGALSFSGQYKAFKHIAPYIDINDTVYSLEQQYADCPKMFGYPNSKKSAQGFLIEKADGKGEVAILINPNENDKLQVQFKLNDTIYYAELSPASISTIY